MARQKRWCLFQFTARESYRNKNSVAGLPKRQTALRSETSSRANSVPYNSSDPRGLWMAATPAPVKRQPDRRHAVAFTAAKAAS